MTNNSQPPSSTATAEASAVDLSSADLGVLQMTQLSLKGQRVLVREDLNVPIKDGAIASDARIRAAIPSLREALDAGAKVLVMSHLGRPTEGEYDDQFSLAPVAARLTELLGQTVTLIKDWDQMPDLANGQCALFENVRFMPGEKANDTQLAQRMANLCDIYVMDAFGTAHRAQASTHGVAQVALVACAGPLLARELAALHQALADPKRPLMAIVGGAKVSTKLEVLGALASQAEQIIVGGGIANTFLAAAGIEVGKSLYEPDLLEAARKIADQVEIPLPVDVMVGKNFDESEAAVCKRVEDVAADDMIMDVGPETARRLQDRIAKAGTILWNGPLGVFEFDQFGEGTRMLSEAIADSAGFSIAGGGDTLAAIDKYQVEEGVSYISTGGGAFLEFVEGKTLPAVAALMERERTREKTRAN